MTHETNPEEEFKGMLLIPLSVPFKTYAVKGLVREIGRAGPLKTKSKRTRVRPRRVSDSLKNFGRD